MAISHDEAVAKLTTLRAEAEALVQSFNEAYQSEKLKEANSIAKQIDEKVNEYSNVARTDCFEMCKQSADPMLTAVRTLSFITIGVKDEQKDDDKIPVRKVIEKEKPIDLFKLYKYCGDNGIGADPKWLYMAEQFNCLLTAQKAQDLGIDPKQINDSYAMSNIAKQIDLGKNPTSKTNLLKTLQTVITAMIGEGYKATSHDVNFLLSVYSKKSRKALTVTAANHRYLRGYLAEICHRIVEGKTYGIEYKAVKAQ